ncbi:MAG: NRDE family protein [Lysobacteraceae bacterium]
MCLIAFAWQMHPCWPLILIGNRDEWHARAATEAGFQPDAPRVYGGRDLEANGGWLQVSANSRLATVTNVRLGPATKSAPRSRGALVADFVRDSIDAEPWLEALAPDAADYGPFQLLLWDGEQLQLAGNQPGFFQRPIEAGVHGLSNGPFDAPWPKVQRLRGALEDWLDADATSNEPDLAPLFAGLADTRVASDDQLPDTGVGFEMERWLSSPFVMGERYGTRCSSIVLVGREDIRFVERRFGPNGVEQGQSEARIDLR